MGKYNQFIWKQISLLDSGDYTSDDKIAVFDEWMNFNRSRSSKKEGR